ncbi:MAG: DNA-directed RNA polymerase [Candidatus Nanohaloarchaea archaeon]|nr:DNA-directed RNA polymerase [Candidatus Nanohaloarchaea archaeon]
MYRKLKIQDTVRVPPELLGRKVEESVEKSLKQRYEGNIENEAGVILLVEDLIEIGDGDINPEDAGVHYPVKYRAIAYQPELHEVVEGEVVDITDFGAFVRVGPLDGLVHVSQVMDDYVSYDEKQGMLSGKDGSRSLQVGDIVRARVTAVSLDSGEDNKLNLTMRQPMLGKLEWVEEKLEEEEEEEDEE